MVLGTPPRNPGHATSIQEAPAATADLQRPLTAQPAVQSLQGQAATQDLLQATSTPIPALLPAPGPEQPTTSA